MKSIWKYAPLLPAVEEAARVSLGEGGTPLVPSRHIGKVLGLKHLYFKLENLNPTGSYKDRFAALLISGMKAAGQRTCIATSSGNAGAALAAYSAAAGMACYIVVVDGAPEAKLRQMQLFGARLIMIRDFGKSADVTQQVFDELEALSKEMMLPLPVSAYRYSPRAMQGVETIAYEICEELNGAETDIFVPAGGGGLTLAVATGILKKGAPGKVHCIQPEGNDTIATSLRKGVPAVAQARSVTKISGLQVANVLDGHEVIEACRKLGGTGYTVPDEDVYRWHREMAFREGIFCEPAGAVALAGLEKAVAMGEIHPDRKIVCMVTGSGFKDMAAVANNFGLEPPLPMPGSEAMDQLRKGSNKNISKKQ